jgi:hypothetical protein
MPQVTPMKQERMDMNTTDFRKELIKIMPGYKWTDGRLQPIINIGSREKTTGSYYL